MPANEGLAYISLPRCGSKLARSCISKPKVPIHFSYLGSTAHHAQIMWQECNYASSRWNGLQEEGKTGSKPSRKFSRCRM